MLLDSYTKVSELSSYVSAFGIDCHCIALSLQARLPRPGSQRAVHSLEVSVLAPRHIVPTGVLSVAGTASARGWRAVTASAAETEVTLSPAWLCFGVPAGKHFLEPGNKKKYCPRGYEIKGLCMRARRGRGHSGVGSHHCQGFGVRPRPPPPPTPTPRPDCHQSVSWSPREREEMLSRVTSRAAPSFLRLLISAVSVK